MKILITGVPGTGKSTLAKYLKTKLNFELVELNNTAKKFKIKKDKWGALIVDIKKTEKELNILLENKDNIILDGHLGCDMKLNVDKVFVLRCNPKILKKRLIKRKYPEDKIMENIEAEMIDYALVRCEDNYEKRNIPVIEMMGTKSVKAYSLKEIKTKKSKKINLDWLSK
ncbi:AAA family ATPase [Candidatus Micrarchaeota archaeon]|jgi:adenylate kinase|nr:AAA family ATPase [Candidatus Micrarchaeota archaeon]